MTPKEKAKELVNKFSWIDCSGDSKQCALICVDEMINTDINKDYIKVDGYMYSFIEFYVEVKQEIEKL
jgi:hypothetical protein